MSAAKKSKQVQKSGDSSVNIQAGQITVGPTYQAVKAIALDVFKTNFYQLSSIAMDTAQKRAEEITNKFLDELMKKNPQGLKNAEEPDFQYALFTVQKEYAKSGNKDLGSILVDILVDRTKEANRNLMQIVLDESIQTAPKLTSNQYAALSVIFALKYTKYLKIVNLSEFSKYIGRSLSPFVPELVKENACYQHLEYAGCGTIGIGSVSIEKVLLSNYLGLFVKGFKQNDISDLLEEEPRLLAIISKCLRDPNLLQIRAIDEPTIHTIASQRGIESSAVNKLIEVQKKHTMNEKEVKDYSVSAHPCMKDLYDVWDNSSMKNMTLTSVGIAIAHANIRRVTGEQYDLSIWIK